MPTDFLEKTLEDIIFENKTTIHSYGLPVFKSQSFRQVVLPSGKKIDILAFELNNGHLNLDIYELKKEIINPDAISQAFGYVDEIAFLINGAFKGWSAEIIMVGKKYEPLSLIKYTTIPVKVYTYDYRINGIRFLNVNNERYFQHNEAFALEIWAWGLGRLQFNAGRQPNTVNFHSGFSPHLGKDFSDIIKSERDKYVFEQKLLPASTSLKPIVTEHFPIQPSWSSEFASGIPHYDIFEDLGDNDICDFEIEELEEDTADYESTHDDENEPDLESDNIENQS